MDNRVDLGWFIDHYPPILVSIGQSPGNGVLEWTMGWTFSVYSSLSSHPCQHWSELLNGVLRVDYWVDYCYSPILVCIGQNPRMEC